MDCEGGPRIMPEPDLQLWALLYSDCLAETDPLKLQTLVVALEEAITQRLRELNSKAGGQHEILALETAANNVLASGSSECECVPDLGSLLLYRALPRARKKVLQC
jgi:hypothetical protein